MNNLIVNRMVINNNEDIKTVFRFDIDDRGDAEGIVGFDKAVPIPSTLEDVSLSLSEKRLYYFLSEELTLRREDVCKKIEKLGLDYVFPTEIADEVSSYINPLFKKERKEFFTHGKNTLFNIINYGVQTLQEWYLKYWGCEGNAHNSKIIEKRCNGEYIVIYFETLGTPPLKWCRTISDLIDFTLDWEGRGFQGRIRHVFAGDEYDEDMYSESCSLIKKDKEKNE